MDEKQRKLNSAKEFLVEHKIHSLIEMLTTELVQTKPNQPVDYLIQRLRDVKGGVTVEAKRPHIIFVLGGPGSGKGTVCASIVDDYGCVHISVGDLMRQEVRYNTEVGKQIADYVADGCLVPTDIVVSLLGKEVEKHGHSKTILIEGFPKDLAQAIRFEKTVYECARVVSLEAPSSVLESRLHNRGAYSHRSDDTPAAISSRLDIYMTKTRPVLEYYDALGKLFMVDGTQSEGLVKAELAPLFT
eukprot:TRINITY_DN30119_c0_g1_i1.p1 TRINITY_DN30119_c0_g1~~TRINITY_DN30119_c0_g1_i1.p1  ORF type:complete len:244 (+),score=37.93 TRINITY_DN30119_c0_g1_i1:51-782(+)